MWDKCLCFRAKHARVLKKLHFILYCVSVLTASITLHAQQNNIWYFGSYSGLDFNTAGGPRPLGNSAMIADEGSSSICDDDGNLLFYTNGVTVYNRNHVQMLNGDNIGGNLSSFQSSVIVQHPGNRNQYYIFTTDAVENYFVVGYRYSMVDMTGDNGNGVVTQKNNPLWAPCSERIAAVRHSNGVDVWLITNDYNSNIFRAWLIDCNGLLFSNTVSIAGDVMDVYPSMNVGALKFSPDGLQMCQTHFSDIDVVGGSSPHDFFQVFDFNNTTGVISNARKISVPGAKYMNCEYSPNSQFLYLASGAFVDQFQAKLPTPAAIVSSRISIPSSNMIFGMLLGPDGKIYLSALSMYLDVISNPDAPGAACNLKIKHIQLLKSAKLGFPNFVNDISSSPYNNFNIQVLDSCTGVVQFSASSNISSTPVYSWDFGDGNTSNLQNPLHTYSNPKQTYLVKLTITSPTGCGTVVKSKQVTPAGIVSIPDFNFFGGCDSGYIRFEIINPVDTGGGVLYIWDFGDGNTSTELNPKHIYTQMSSFNVKLKLKTTTLCRDDSITKVVDMGDLSGITTVSPDQVIFNGQTIRLFADGPGQNYQWTPATALSNPFIPRPLASPTSDIVYTVRISTSTGCFVERSVRITVVDLDSFYVPTGFTPNNDGRNDVLRPVFGTKFTLKQFSVFNRWGQQVFTTSAIGMGWDGKLQNILQETGVYVWILRIQDATGALIEKKGTAALIR